MAKNLTLLITCANSLPYSSLTVLISILRRPMRFVTESTVLPFSSSRSSVTVYSGCPPSPLGHQSSGLSIRRLSPYAISSLSYNISPSGLVRVTKVLSPINFPSAPGVSSLSVPARFTEISKESSALDRSSLKPCLIYVFPNLAVFTAKSSTSFHIPASGNLGPQSQPNI